MAIVHEFVVALEHRPGSLAAVTRSLAGAGVNLLGVSVETPGSRGFARFLVDPSQAHVAARALRGDNYSYATGEALALKLPNRPGALAEVSERLGRSGVNIEGVYGFASSANEGQVVIRADDLPAAARALGEVQA
jgi:hypothetical protein